MDQWQQQSYSDSAGSSRRYNGNPPPSQAQMARDYNGNSQAQPPARFTYEQYQGGMGAHPHTIATSPTATPQMRDGNGDVAMQDAGDPYSGLKYPMRPHHQQHLSGNTRTVPHHTPQDASATQRYSPMETLSPTATLRPSRQHVLPTSSIKVAWARIRTL
jgi:dual specificity protein kinase YAK1